MSEDRDPFEQLRADAAPPADVVPRPPLTAETVLRLRAMAGRPVTFVIPGEPIPGADGEWIGMSEPTTVQAVAMAPIISAAEAERLGIPQYADDEEYDDE